MAKPNEYKSKYYQLASLALDVALAAPLKEGHRWTKAYIPWRLIIEIREEADRRGFQWRDVHPQNKAAK